MKWISVKEKLPEKNTHVLVCNKNRIWIAELEDDDDFHNIPDDYYCDPFASYGVTNWMPLPELPKEDCGDQ